MKKHFDNINKSTNAHLAKRGLLTVLCSLMSLPCMASGPNAFSQYGQIQNVQSYSSNPFWNPNSPYNARMPQPVYATGPSVSAADCQNIVGALVSYYCASRNNCVGLTLDQVRPTLIVQMASYSDKNYVTACAGYLDTEFEGYKAQYANAGLNTTTKAVSFPSGPTVANPTATTGATAFPTYGTTQNTDIINSQKKTSEQEQSERLAKLHALQAGNQNSTADIVGGEFPVTAADLSFAERMANAKAGYEEIGAGKTYQGLKLAEDEWKDPCWGLNEHDCKCLKDPTQLECKCEKTPDTQECICWKDSTQPGCKDYDPCKDNPNLPECQKTNPPSPTTKTLCDAFKDNSFNTKLLTSLKSKATYKGFLIPVFTVTDGKGQESYAVLGAQFPKNDTEILDYVDKSFPSNAPDTQESTFKDIFYSKTGQTYTNCADFAYDVKLEFLSCDEYTSRGFPPIALGKTQTEFDDLCSTNTTNKREGQCFDYTSDSLKTGSGDKPYKLPNYSINYKNPMRLFCSTKNNDVVDRNLFGYGLKETAVAVHGKDSVRNHDPKIEGIYTVYLTWSGSSGIPEMSFDVDLKKHDFAYFAYGPLNPIREAYVTTKDLAQRTCEFTRNQQIYITDNFTLTVCYKGSK